MDNQYFFLLGSSTINLDKIDREKKEKIECKIISALEANQRDMTIWEAFMVGKLLKFRKEEWKSVASWCGDALSHLCPTLVSVNFGSALLAWGRGTDWTKLSWMKLCTFAAVSEKPQHICTLVSYREAVNMHRETRNDWAESKTQGRSENCLTS